jgi:uncharacterized protein YcbK (DUF882 family)
VNSKYFKHSEFTCKGSGDNFVKIELMLRLDKVREELGAPVKVTSGYRSPEHNIKIGGHPNSTHTRGEAADITCKDLDKLYDICCKHFKAVGDGRKKGFVHVDLREDKIRRWEY